MNNVALSIRVFAIYLFGTAATLIFAPNLLLKILGIAVTEEHWIRLVGMLVFFIGYYYWRASAVDARQFFEWTVFGRLALVSPFFIGFVLMGWMPPIMLSFAVIDVLGGLWTRAALKNTDSFGSAGATVGSKR